LLSYAELWLQLHAGMVLDWLSFVLGNWHMRALHAYGQLNSDGRIHAQFMDADHGYRRHGLRHDYRMFWFA